jgi:hypothetical protein
MNVGMGFTVALHIPTPPPSSDEMTIKPQISRCSGAPGRADPIDEYPTIHEVIENNALLLSGRWASFMSQRR